MFDRMALSHGIVLRHMMTTLTILVATLLTNLLTCLPTHSALFAQSGPEMSDGQPTGNLKITLLDGNTFTGELSELNAEGLKLQSEQGLVQWTWDQVAQLSTEQTPTIPADAATVRLNHGTLLLWTRWSADRNQAQGWSGSNSVTIPSSAIHWIRQAATPVPLWEETLKDAGKSSDAVVVQKGDRLDWLDSVIRRYSQDEVSFTFQQRQASVPTTRTAGLIFFQPPRAEKARGSQLTDITGQQWMVQRWEIKDQELTLHLAEEFSVTLPWNHVARWDFASLRFLSLSKVRPDQFTWQPMIPIPGLANDLQQWNAPRSDAGFDQQPLEVCQTAPAVSKGTAARDELMEWLGTDTTSTSQRQWTTFQEGLAVKVGSQLTYLLNDRYQRMTGVVGLARPLSTNQAARIVISADNQPVWQQRLDASEQPSLPLDLELRGPQRLTIAVQWEADQAPCDVVYFGNLRLLK